MCAENKKKYRFFCSQVTCEGRSVYKEKKVARNESYIYWLCYICMSMFGLFWPEGKKIDFAWAKTWSGTPLLFSSAKLSFHKYPLYSIFKPLLPRHSQPFRAAEAVRRAGTLAFSLSRQHNLHSSSWGQSGSKFGIEAGVVPWDTPPTKRFLSPMGGSLARWLRAPRLRLSTNFAHGRLIKPTFSDPFSFVLPGTRARPA